MFMTKSAGSELRLIDFGSGKKERDVAAKASTAAASATNGSSSAASPASGGGGGGGTGSSSKAAKAAVSPAPATVRDSNGKELQLHTTFAGSG